MSTRENEIERIIWALQKLWLQNPQQRFGQLLENYVFPSALTKEDVRTALTFYQDDTETFKAIIRNINFSDYPLKKEKTET